VERDLAGAGLAADDERFLAFLTPAYAAYNVPVTRKLTSFPLRCACKSLQCFNAVGVVTEMNNDQGWI